MHSALSAGNPNRSYTKTFFHDEYEVTKVIGFGGLSHVYLVEKNGQRIAAKSIRAEFINNFLMAKQHRMNLSNIVAMTLAVDTFFDRWHRPHYRIPSVRR